MITDKEKMEIASDILRELRPTSSPLFADFLKSHFNQFGDYFVLPENPKDQKVLLAKVFDYVSQLNLDDLVNISS